jgi:hypothetical protein
MKFREKTAKTQSPKISTRSTATLKPKKGNKAPKTITNVNITPHEQYIYVYIEQSPDFDSFKLQSFVLKKKSFVFTLRQKTVKKIL